MPVTASSVPMKPIPVISKAFTRVLSSWCASRLEGRPVRPGADYRARQLREIVGYLGEHFTEPLSLPEVASHFGLSPQYFSTFFRENFGRTFTQHINSLRIEQAARLLRETDLPVMEVGFSVGFDNFSYFIKRFRSVYGVSPSHYRKG